MKKSYIALILTLALCLTLCACGKDTPETTTPTEPQQTTEPLAAVPETTAPTQSKPEETEPEETGPDYDAYTELMRYTGAESSWVSRAMTCVFGQPEDIDLYHFFYGDLAGGWDSISEESRNYLTGQGYHTDMDLQVRPLDTMEQIMQQVFGISLSDVEDGIPDQWRYLATEKAYVSNHNDTNVVADFTITWIDEYVGNRIDIFYTINGSYYNTATGETLKNPDMVLALRQQPDGSYLVLANVEAPTK